MNMIWFSNDAFWFCYNSCVFFAKWACIGHGKPSGRAPLKEMLHIESLIHGQETWFEAGNAGKGEQRPLKTAAWMNRWKCFHQLWHMRAITINRRQSFCSCICITIISQVVNVYQHTHIYIYIHPFYTWNQTLFLWSNHMKVFLLNHVERCWWRWIRQKAKRQSLHSPALRSPQAMLRTVAKLSALWSK